jgi:peptidoglycan/LPS O-acetylase OafA/YrhL
MAAKTEIRAFPALDGLRGVAAILVALFHFRSEFVTYDDFPMGDGYLAVDLFFVLSGFVLAHAYAARFRQGMSIIQFMKIRLIRLYPLYFLGLIAGATVLALGLRSRETFDFTQRDIALCFISGTLLLPCSKSQLFPINPPAWSLFFELIVNLLFVAFWRRLNLRILYIIFTFSGSVICACALYKHKIAFGSSLNSIPAGLLRTIFSFSLGLILHHHYDAGRLRVNVGSAYFLAGIIVLVASLLIPVNQAVRGVYDMAFVAVISPMLVAIGISSRLDKRLIGLLSFLGTTSYALYALHYTTINIFRTVAFKFFGEPPVFLISALGVASLLGVTYAVDLFYDRPVRRVLIGPMTAVGRQRSNLPRETDPSVAPQLNQ